ncbi:hypothetical protein AB832_06775 [Flavobacteriaceae bacterium (ex Bugula neritina AB1)]|nr:hypothetical protein AB832_06775 [Flavobacteriaceae bacterium (ex Bugula neritina AB1)]
MENSESLIQILFWGSLLIFIFICAIVAFFILHNKKVLAYQKLLLQTSIESEEKERKRIAKDLHDALNGHLYNARNFILSPDQIGVDINEKSKEVAGMIGEAMDTIRDISKDLAPPTLDKFGLVDGLKELCKKMRKVSKRQIIFMNKSEPFRLTYFAEINLFRIVQELLQNAIKYSEAVTIELDLHIDNGFLQIMVKDNGIGFDYEQKKLDPKGGLGLRNIESRIQLLNGTCSIDSAMDKGTITTVKLELSKHRI